MIDETGFLPDHRCMGASGRMAEREHIAAESNPDCEVANLYGKHAAELLRWALALAPDADTAHDAVQEAFLRYVIERRCGRAVEKPRSWLHVVMRNYLSRRGAVTAPELAVEELDRVAGGGHDPEELALRSDLTRRVFSRLTSRETECLRLRAEGRPYAEIADLLSIRPGTVGALLARVQLKVKELVGVGPVQ
jgi:RNA polymerase sigma factor (sigma-70 family)